MRESVENAPSDEENDDVSTHSTFLKSINIFYFTGIFYWNILLEYFTGIFYWNILLEYFTGIFCYCIVYLQF